MKLRKLGRRGGTVMDNLLGLILVGIALIIFIVAVYKFYRADADQETRIAQATAEDLIGKLNLLEDGESANFTFRASESWNLYAWNIDDDSRPDKCALGSCICLCPLLDSVSPRDACQEKGFCRQLDRMIVLKEFAFRAPGAGMGSTPTLQVFEGGTLYLGVTEGAIYELAVSKGASSINVTHYDDNYFSYFETAKKNKQEVFYEVIDRHTGEAKESRRIIL